MQHRASPSLRRRNWLRFLVTLLFALNLPLSMSFATVVGPDRGETSAPAMSCHEPATPQSRDDGKSDPAAALQHLCCFAACIPLAASADAAIALALPVGDPLVTMLPMRPTPRAIGVDPPPPRA